MSQRFRKERREKYSAAATGLGFCLLITAVMARNIGDLQPGARGPAWNQYLVSVLIAAVPTALWLWSLTPWDEVPREKQRLGVAGILTAGAGGSTINYFLQKDPDVLRIVIGACVGFFLGGSVVFLLVGVFRRWRSEETSLRR